MTRPDYTALLPGALLAATAGSLDGYTFLHQGAVFAGLQTGNLILLGVHLGGGQWAEAAHYAGALLTFMLGTAVARGIQHRYQGARLDRGTLILCYELLLISLALLVTQLGPQPLVTWLLAAAAAAQLQEFRSLHGAPFTSLMMTGNLRLLVESGYDWLIRREHQAKRRTVDILVILLSFAAGAAAVQGLSFILGRSALVLALASLMLVIATGHRKKV
ncbi:YoaK family protein [Lacticaseibacillus suibinensis]|uniref:YoaK family protein n=1 Tax=Lacticaseibacillus suibinensis TaxID=2486011 RepID=UPI000F7943D7|nr:YoaK family protein [Lacticaseibacillus suibinensis]